MNENSTMELNKAAGCTVFEYLIRGISSAKGTSAFSALTKPERGVGRWRTIPVTGKRDSIFLFVQNGCREK